MTRPNARILSERLHKLNPGLFCNEYNIKRLEYHAKFNCYGTISAFLSIEQYTNLLNIDGGDEAVLVFEDKTDIEQENILKNYNLRMHEKLKKDVSMLGLAFKPLFGNYSSDELSYLIILPRDDLGDSACEKRKKQFLDILLTLGKNIIRSQFCL